MKTYSIFDCLLHCRGTSGIDIDLQKVDIDQCPLSTGSKDLNVFAGSDKCKIQTTRVSTRSISFDINHCDNKMMVCYNVK